MYQLVVRYLSIDFKTDVAVLIPNCTTTSAEEGKKAVQRLGPGEKENKKGEEKKKKKKKVRSTLIHFPAEGWTVAWPIFLCDFGLWFFDFSIIPRSFSFGIVLLITTSSSQQQHV